MILTSPYHHAAGRGKGYLNQSMFLTHSHLLPSKKEKKKSWRKVLISSLLMDLLHRLPGLVSPVYLGVGPEMKTNHLTVLFFGTQNSFCQYGIQSAVRILDLKNWDLNFALRGKKDSLQNVTKIPLQNWGGLPKVLFFCFLFFGGVFSTQGLRQLLKNSNVIRLSPIRKTFLVFWLK